MVKLRRTLTAALAVWLAAPTGAWADMAPGNGSGYGHMAAWGMVFGPLVGVLFIAAIAVAVVLVVRAVGGGAAPRGGGKSALDILDERFARGEIDDKEHAARKQVLTGG